VNIRWTTKAIHNLEMIEQYIAAENPQAAITTIDKIINAVELIADHPAAGRPGRVIGTRELIITGTPYLIPYRVKQQQVEIIRILYGAMIWPTKDN
jgi:toxin ParE1/3/4